MGSSGRQLKAMLRKNWLLKIRHPFVTLAEIVLPTVVMLLLMGVRTGVDTKIHPTQPYIKKHMFVEVGKGDVSPSFEQILESLLAKGECLAFAPDTQETMTMIEVLSMRFPLLKVVTRVFKDEVEMETYIRSELYGARNQLKNCSNAKIKGAIIFHEQGPHLFDYSIRLNHSWAFSGFPDVKSIMDTNGPYVNDLELGVDTVPTLQYGFSGFLTLQQVLDSFIIFAAQEYGTNGEHEYHKSPLFNVLGTTSTLPWTSFSPLNIRIAPFPTRAYTDDEFQSIIKKVMGVLYLVGFLYPVSRLISYSVFEKEHKIKEGLYMMGLKDEIFYLSWLITYSIQFAISSGLITVCTMGSLFMYSNETVVFVYFFLFGLSAIMLSFLISTFFARAKTAVAVGTLSFLGAFLPYYMVNDPDVPMIVKVVASLFSPTAFALGTVNIADYERAHVGVRWSNIWRASSGVNFLVCLLMMLLDTLLYCAIGLYLDKVLPRENGTCYPWNFLFKKSFWGKKRMPPLHVSIEEAKSIDKLCRNKATVSGSGTSEPPVEAISLDMKQQEHDGRCVQIRNLHKVYVTKKRKCCAVNSLQLTLYENQILALLGHNGAGKSTTISMLIGLLPPSSGDAVVFGKNIKTDMDEIRKGLGVCPQNDILFQELTVKEHMEIFAILKGVKEESLERIVNEMVDEELDLPDYGFAGNASLEFSGPRVGLTDKVNTIVRALSGGMRRKLSLGIALVGNSKVIILDEPTSGMDPYSMRSTWQLIKKVKKGRVILLTTHSMDEAEVLGDRIAIMANGSLRCCGSSLFLKHKYGVGYTLTLAKTTPSASAVADIVCHHVPSATRLTDVYFSPYDPIFSMPNKYKMIISYTQFIFRAYFLVGTEISFRLPLASSSSFEDMFREIEGYMRRPDGIESYGISVTTLEEVFLRVARCDLEIEDVEQNTTLTKPDHLDSEVSNFPATWGSYSKLLFGSSKEAFGMVVTTIGRACSLVIAMVLSFISFLTLQCCGCCIILRSTFWEHFKALFIKRAITASRDRRTIVFQLVIPAFFLLFGLLFLKLKPHPDQQSVTFTTSYFNPLLQGGGGGGPIPFNLSFPIVKMVSQYVEGGWIQKVEPRSYKFPDSEKALAEAIEVAGPRLGPALISMSEFLITSLNESYQSRYGAVLMDDINIDGSLGYTILHNSSCQHAAPTFINLMHGAILRMATRNPNMTIRTRNHPLPMTKSQHSQHHDLDAFSAAIIVNIAFSFIPASFAVSIVKEREVKAKHQQLISGNVILLLNLFTGLILMVISFIMGLFETTKSANLFLKFSFILAVKFATSLGKYIKTREMESWSELKLASFQVVLILSCIMFLTALAHSFSKHQGILPALEAKAAAGESVLIQSISHPLEAAQATPCTIAVHSSMKLFILQLLNDPTQLNAMFGNIFRLSPGFCFADGLASLALRRQGIKLGTSDGILDWNVTGASICHLFVESVIYFILAIGLEFLPSHKLASLTIKEWWCSTPRQLQSVATKGHLEPLLESSSSVNLSIDVDKDIDVEAERHRVLSGSVENALICLHSLRKVYPGRRNQNPKVAVNSLTFAVQEGECFGFLGTNGAGKTTTLSMLSGEECPTDGTAYIFGKDIRSNPEAVRRHIGYCPQFDALFELLTVQEHLELYARIKGVPENRIKNVVEEKMVEFDLWGYSNKPSYSLSGGNKRKLSVAIAMIGDPPIVILDEPSTGMDPIAKRFMWEVISRLSTRLGKTAVILTTHSMNEAQALCTRIGIMVGGGLRCIGSPQHLKSRFGNHLELELKPTEVSSVELDKLCRRIQEMLFDMPCHPRNILSDLETCIGRSDLLASDNVSVAEISLSPDLIMVIGRWLGNQKRIETLRPHAPITEGVFEEQLSEQLIRDGGIPLLIFSEWWLAKERFSVIDSFILSSFPEATFQGSNGLSVKYQEDARSSGIQYQPINIGDDF
ncbi:hypothetical protein GIB67_019804 [Kingdonia uniflora]|uniref:ABC transporter domain-containing protein n=1 Tax=Kingdonia uniflora TaxID=39325 RepID=A0A7J7MKK9_9MAGN|nr:hypothetical protein GIB67_019804 [Kingdonia uniflora]